MFHGNFWSNMEMNLATGKLEEKDSRLSDARDALPDDGSGLDGRAPAGRPGPANGSLRPRR